MALRARLAGRSHKGRGDSSHSRESEEDPVRAIIKAAKAIPLSDWETNAFIALCQSRNSLKKGKNILIEYSQLKNDIFVLLGKRNSYLRKVFCVIGSHNKKELVQQLPGHFRKLAEYSLKAWISICRWRQLQWTPRPISITSDGAKSSVINFHTEFDSQLQLLMHKLKESQISLPYCGVDIKDLLVFLLTSSTQGLREESGIHLAELLYLQDQASHRRNFNQSALLAPYQDLQNVFTQLFAEEISSYNTWSNFSSADVFPVLAIRYGDLVQTSLSGIEVYDQATQLLLTSYYIYFTQSNSNVVGLQKSVHDEVRSFLVELNKRQGTPPKSHLAQVATMTNNSNEISLDDGPSVASSRQYRSVDSLDCNSDAKNAKHINPIRHSFVLPKHSTKKNSEKRPMSSGAVSIRKYESLPRIDKRVSKSEAATPRILSSTPRNSVIKENENEEKSLRVMLHDLEKQFNRIELTLEDSPNIESFRQLRDNLLQKIRENENHSIPEQGNEKSLLASSPSQILESTSILSTSPNFRNGSTIMRKSILKNQLTREGSFGKFLEEGKSTFQALSHRKSRRDSDISSISSTPSSSPKLNFTFFPFEARVSISSSTNRPSWSSTRKSSQSYSRVFLSKSSLVVLREALRVIVSSSDPRAERKIAASKIQIWWRLVLPQRKLFHSLWVKELCQSCVYQMFDWAYEKTIQIRRIRRQILREGAAIKIQRRFRIWRRTILLSCIRIQRFTRRWIARKGISQFVTEVRAGIMIARFLCARRKRLGLPVGKKQIYRRVLRGFFETIGIRLREKKMKMLEQSRFKRERVGQGRCRSRILQVSKRDIEISKIRNRAVIRIQALTRRWAAVKVVEERRRVKHQYQQICLTRVLGKILLIIKRHKVKRLAVTKIASAWRGCCSRWKLMIKVLASYKIRSCWRSYKEYWKLKRCLRRGEIPVTIVLHGLTNIPSGVLTTGSLKVRVSVWWSSLLHLVEKKSDFQTVIQSKNPNITRTTSLYYAEENQGDSPNPIQENKIIRSPKSSRKMSLSEQTRLLMPHESCRKLTDSEKLAEFARQQGNSSQRNSFRLGSVGFPHRPSFGGQSPEPAHMIIEESEDSSTESSEPQLGQAALEAVRSSDNSDSDSDFDTDVFVSKLPDEKVTPNKIPRLSVDNIGRDCTNLIGSNLISDLTVETAEVSSTLNVAKKILQTSLSIELTHPSPTRVLLKPLSRSEQDHRGAHYSPFTNLSDNIMSALKAPALPAHGGRNVVTKFSVNLHDETLYVPGCHGNSVIRFDFFDGDIRKVGSYIYELADEKTLMFWGGESVHEIHLNPAGRNRSGANVILKALFSFRVSSGVPQCSRCGWAMVCAKGSGPLMRKTRAKRFLKAFFDFWDNFFLSLDGEWIYLFSARNSPEPYFSIPLAQLKRIHVELALDNQHARSSSENSKMVTMDDRFLVVLSTLSNDMIQLRFQDRFTRENWVRSIVHAVQRSRSSDQQQNETAP